MHKKIMAILVLLMLTIGMVFATGTQETEIGTRNCIRISIMKSKLLL
jgi:hypothetical protein